MTAFRDTNYRFQKANAQVLGISTDQVPTNEAWAKSMGGLSYPLLSDHWPHGYACSLYSVLRRDTGQAERAIFVIDKAGKVAYIDIHNTSAQPPTDKIMAALDKLK